MSMSDSDTSSQGIEFKNFRQISSESESRTLSLFSKGLLYEMLCSAKTGDIKSSWKDVTHENKLRLLMIYAAVYPKKFKDDKVAKLMEELIEKHNKGELPKNEYPYMNNPSPTFHGTSLSGSVQTSQAPAAYLMRSRRTSTWARPQNLDDGDSILRHASSDFKKMGQQIFVFIVGGATRSEKLKLLTAHEL